MIYWIHLYNSLNDGLGLHHKFFYSKQEMKVKSSVVDFIMAEII